MGNKSVTKRVIGQNRKGHFFMGKRDLDEIHVTIP